MLLAINKGNNSLPQARVTSPQLLTSLGKTNKVVSLFSENPTAWRIEIDIKAP